MSGYDPTFLDGISLPMPRFSHSVHNDVLREIDDLTDGYVVDYVNYSLVMNRQRSRRSPMFVALNIDQNQLRDTNRDNNWKIDERVGVVNQLDNDYYRSNPWDRGHMARRVSAAWGRSKRAAQRADEETFYYTNSTLQHENLNQDEWLALEDWVLDLALDADGKISTFSGPFYGDFDRTIAPQGRELALIPAGFFKIVCFKNRESGDLDVRAFVIYQDEEALADKRGRHRYNNQNYQVTVTEIEDLTGLLFEDAIYNANPLIYTLSDGDARTGTIITPERYEVGGPHEIISTPDQRQTIKDDIVDVFITSAMVNPVGADRNSEWIALSNFSGDEVDLSHWQLSDNSNLSLRIGDRVADGEARLKPGESVVVKPLSPLQLSNKRDVIKLHDQAGARIDWVNYSENMLQEGKPVLFLSPRDTLDTGD